MFQTDKGQYKAGDKVRIRLLLHDNFLRKVSYVYDCTMHIYIYNSMKLSDGHLIDLRMIDEKGLTTTEVRKETEISIDTLEY